jgi:hypothetical protein
MASGCDRGVIRRPFEKFVESAYYSESELCGGAATFSFPKYPGREADHLPPSSAEVKNAWSYTSTSQYVFMAWCLVKHRNNFTCLLYLYLPLAGDTLLTTLHPLLENVNGVMR